jgi:predicted DCC family thiol-disulfide oxidoreductase YuxK
VDAAAARSARQLRRKEVTAPAEESVAPAEAPPEAPRPRRWPAFRAAFTRLYLTIDPRSLGLGRIILALLLLFDLFHRVYGGVELWYSNAGLLPNHTLLWRPPTQWMFSLFYMASFTDEAVLGFVLCGLCYVGLLVGWRTRLMQVLSFIAVMSLHSRTPFLENGGDWTVGELALWTMFLPLGRRFSIDSLRASMRARRETTAAELNDRAALAGDTTPVISLAVLAIVLQLANAYLFNALHKGGHTWRSGSAVFYVLWQDRMVTPIAVWMRPHMTLWMSRIFSWSALATEAMLPMLLLLPFYKAVTRRMAIFAILGLHAGFQVFINLGCFSLAMMSFTPYLIAAADWELLSRWARRKERSLTVYFDAGCGVCFQIARLLARIDRHGRLRFVSSADADKPPKGVTHALLEKTIVVVDGTGAVHTRADGMARIFSMLPLGRLWSWPLRVPGLRQLANVAYDAFARRRTTVSMWLGLAACGVPGAPALAPRPAPEPAPIRSWLRLLSARTREAFVALMLVVFFSETLMINAAVPKFLKFKQPTWVMPFVAYPRLIQAWSMFASDAPMTDESVVVDAVTVDGRHVDPYSEVSGRYDFPGHDNIPPRLDNDSFFFNYSSRIPFKSEYWTALQEWILRYPERTGRPQDAIVKFDVWIVEDDSPAPGEMKEKNIRSRIFLSYPR